MTVFDRLYQSHTASSRAKRKTGASPEEESTATPHPRAGGIFVNTTATATSSSSSSSSVATPPPIKTQTTKDSLLSLQQSPGSPTGGEDLTEQTMMEDEDAAALDSLLHDDNDIVGIVGSGSK